MNGINLNLTPEQFALITKVLEPYVNLFATMNAQYKSQLQPPVKAEKVKKDDIEEIAARG